MKLGPDPAPIPASRRVLDEANEIIHGDRAASYGDAAASFRRIGALWTDYLGDRLLDEITGYDVAMLMVLLKVSRTITDHKDDTLVDIAGYAGLAAAIREAP